ncbi:putative glycine dehydrogenase (decarboxylating) [Austwickia sp. TVS 96-490-7B]|uniref:aminomethyl-transferring glycine dehydrogenase n=1 Tax=Austwickia sp. TVS 96-490-7B TaxID=2830843 RepID=UPI001C56F1ED|nr:aminomethyl-transferring glycine dehydrogenase [Austwickia sp. TVS 96-490-7B]MBW3086279.1 putative glycine dehydrogenase (decarboxylating) [Austwickia sp. TVS 96-490-7B]
MTTHPSALPEFAARHIGPRYEDIVEMLTVIGRKDLDDLVSSTLPEALRDQLPLPITPADSEQAVLDELRRIAAQNVPMTSLIGLGYYNTVTPSVIQRNILENPGWYTAYTPYQPEISQGRLEALLNYQTMIADLTGLDIANSSLLDEATAAGEAMTLMRRATKAAKEAVLLLDRQVYPQTAAVVKARALPLHIDVIDADLSDVDGADALMALTAGRPVFGVIVQCPGTDGTLHDWRSLADAVHAQGGLVTAAQDLLAVTLMVEPGRWGADIAVGTTQRFGVPMGFGGPHAGYLAVRERLARTMPGRLVGVSVDADGAPAYRLALQTREQHIRREKATSNICTAQVLLAVMASMYAVYHGPAGLRRIATRVHGHAEAAVQAFRAAGLAVHGECRFDRVVVRVPGRATQVMNAAVSAGYNLWQVDPDTVAMSFDEATTPADVTAVLAAFDVREVTESRPQEPEWPTELCRDGDFLTADVFNTYHSETQMMRYLRRLADKDYALDRGMIPLGSCTMKLNAATEMQAITWPEFAGMHPFVPADQSAGSRRIVADLQAWLTAITGYDEVTLQPNSGASGELAALMAIRAYHRDRGEEQRDICLIPASAHGTNAASAAMAGFRVVVVKTADDGSIDLEDLRAKVDKHRDVLAVIMITYPSTHGVYEDTVSELCDLVHAAGGQVYVDGANMNALVGLAKPGHFGGDASHLNLHKTFAIPHGGGGPGVGPVGVRAHLAPYLPNHPIDPSAGPRTSPGPAAAAPFGSMGVMPISWAYIRLMGDAGLTRATQVAVLNANYVAARLRAHFPVLYSGPDGVVAHECILDLRDITKRTGVTVDDIAKRLIDYGFHAPTMSFPVAGTLMVEPTESEDKIELDRFCDAMIAIRAEIAEIESGTITADRSALRGAPHTAACLVQEWTADYARADAVYPGGQDPATKYWPPVRRIDGAHGDRNLICSCPAPQSDVD